MKRINQTYKSSITFLALTLSSFTHGDDVDLYLTSTSGNNDVKPNVMFLIDNSGSMSATDVEVTECIYPNSIVADYDPNNTYTGSYDTNRLYIYFAKSTLPASGGSPVASFPLSENYCDAASTALNNNGYALGYDILSYYSASDTWWLFPYGDNSGFPLECEEDSGVHGQTAGSSAVYAQNASVAWTSNASNETWLWAWADNVAMYTGNRMNYEALIQAGSGTVVTPSGNQTCTTHTVNKQRLEVVQDVANDLIDTVSGINLGIMTFTESNASEGGHVRKEVIDIDGDGVDPSTGFTVTNKELLKNVVSALYPSTNTPMGELLYETGLYLRGEAPHFGSGYSTSASISGSNYNSPITDSCQTSNNIILLSDGSPYQDTNNYSTIQSKIGGTCEANPAHNSCLVEVANWIATEDLSSLPGDQFATLYTIGFLQDLDILQQAADETNGGKYFTANNYSSLADTLNQIILRVLATDGAFMSPAVSVNAFNRLQHNNSLYYAMFSPALNARWDGNVKKYTIDENGVIRDREGNEAIDEQTGFFKSGAASYWSDPNEIDDGHDTTLGGARSMIGKRIDSGSRVDKDRSIFTYTGSSAPTSDVTLNSTPHRVADSNTALTAAMFGTTSADERTAYINWLRGYESDGSTRRQFIGDPLHSRPTVVVYGGTSSDDQDTTIFFGTNEGVLHAIDGETGEEQFGFIPQELLSNIPDYYNDTAGLKTYGLDGEVTVWKNDVNNNGVIYDSDGNLEPNEGVYLYIGMRRGGHSYYALDVTDRSSPKLMWRIDGGNGTGTDDFSQLAQTWSAPSLGSVKIGTNEYNVLFFGGGYDENQDIITESQADTRGRSLYMVNANTGELIWSAGPNSANTLTLSDMQYSIPAQVNALDTNGDGFTNVVFASNMGGEIWRFDFSSDATNASNLAKGGKIFDINGSGVANNRKFFAKPDVALFSPRGQAPYFIIASGSGTRPDPLDQLGVVANDFYVLKEYSPFTAPSSYTTKTASDLYDATDNLIQTGTASEQETATSDLYSSQGWYISLEGKDSSGVSQPGEKAFTESTIFGGRLIFTSYTPDFNTTGNGCTLNLGVGRFYALDILTGAAVADLNNDGTIDGDDRSSILVNEGIPPTPTILYSENGSKTICFGAECYGKNNVSDGSGSSKKVSPLDPNQEPFTKTYWREE